MKHDIVSQVFFKGTLVLKPCTARSIAVWQKSIQHDARQRRDNFWVPKVEVTSHDAESIDITQRLARAGYVRQAYSGIFHMLPLGLRVQEKLERLIDKHMRSIQASKVALSSISSQKLWQQSGRLETGSEFFKFIDRKGSSFLLSPTHEEEITSVVADAVQLRSELPVRVYQVTRKYRDELRPRGGLLRGREFIMKDLYTFDASQEQAHATYDEVRTAYRNFLDDLKLSYVEARADSGNMGGSLSHEYHLPSSAGEDNIFHCGHCDFARNEEFVPPANRDHRMVPPPVLSDEKMCNLKLIKHNIISKDNRHLVRAFAPHISIPSEKETEYRPINTYAIKAAFDGILDLDTGVEDPERAFDDALALRANTRDKTPHSIHCLFDARVSPEAVKTQIENDYPMFHRLDVEAFVITSPENAERPIDLLRMQAGDTCPQCKTGTLKMDKCIEIGHTFHLGTRYSAKLDATIPPESGNTRTPMEMGCHGIGVSRLIAAAAACLSDKTGLVWPRVIAPFEVAILVSGASAKQDIAKSLYDQITESKYGRADVLLDDREKQKLGYKMIDSDMIGYPVVVVCGKGLDNTDAQTVEVQCRRLQIKEQVAVDKVPEFVHNLLRQL